MFSTTLLALICDMEGVEGLKKIIEHYLMDLTQKLTLTLQDVSVSYSLQ